MTLDGEVLKAETDGTLVHLTLQAKGTHWAGWREFVEVKLPVRAEEAKPYYVGRLVRITMSPR